VARILAIDAGTTGVRAIVFGDDGQVVGAAYRELLMLYPQPGWVEQDPEDLWLRTKTVIAEAISNAGCEPGHIVAVGVANQRSSAVAWDCATLLPLARMLVWQDTRTADRCAQLGHQGFFVTPNMAVTKFEWILQNVPAARAAAAAGRLRCGTPDAYLCAKLSGGCHATDYSNAATTGLYSHLERTWDATLMASIGIDHGTLPTIVDSSSTIATTDAAVVGFAVPIAALCGDQQSSLYGLGCRVPGSTKCSYGTAAMVDANSGSAITMGGPGTYPLVAWSIAGELTYCVEGTVVTAGAAVQWLRDGLAVIAEASELSALAASVPDSGGVWAIPAFQGLGTPFAAATVRASIGGLSRGSTRAHLARAFLDGIAQRVTDVAASVWESGQRPSALRADGGASANDTLMQMQADLLGMPVERSSIREGAALGVAMLARRAIGDDIDDAPWSPDRAFEPRISDAERQERREAWAVCVGRAAREAV
jgi:glycerol kinase